MQTTGPFVYLLYMMSDENAGAALHLIDNLINIRSEPCWCRLHTGDVSAFSCVPVCPFLVDNCSESSLSCRKVLLKVGMACPTVADSLEPSVYSTCWFCRLISDVIPHSCNSLGCVSFCTAVEINFGMGITCKTVHYLDDCTLVLKFGMKELSLLWRLHTVQNQLHRRDYQHSSCRLGLFHVWCFMRNISELPGMLL